MTRAFLYLSFLGAKIHSDHFGIDPHDRWFVHIHQYGYIPDWVYT